MGYKMNGFSGFGNSPAKRKNNPGEGKTPRETYDKEQSEKDEKDYQKRLKLQEENKEDNKKNVRQGVAKGIASFIGSEKRRQARKDEGAARVSEGVQRAMSRKL